MRRVYKRAMAEKVGEYSEHGNSTIDLKCPFCEAVTTAYIWSLSGGGKMCDGHKCDTIIYRTGEACWLFPLLSEKQEAVLRDVHQFLFAPIGDGWHPNKRTLYSLINKGLIKYGRFLNRAGFGYQVTEMGKAYIEGPNDY